MREIVLAMPVCELFGAGTCGKYLLREFARRGEVVFHPMGELEADEDTMALAQKLAREPSGDVDAPLIQFNGPELQRQTDYAGKPTVGYVFFEHDALTNAQKNNLKAFDVLVAGSTWNTHILNDAGFRCDAVPQGVDTTAFRPMPRTEGKDRFILYSGGKYEHRKAQDLVIRAAKILQQRHADIWLMASWFNIFDPRDHYEAARVAGLRLMALPLMSHETLACYMNQSDVGLFPNRCEGGTNLVLMDYMACGKPVIANDSTGQADVLEPEYAEHIAGDDDALVEQMVESVEMFYRDRSRAARMGANAAQAMQAWSWARTAHGIAAAINRYHIN